MRIVLAPMEGMVDDVLRGVLTDIGGYDWCVTEFIRVSNTRLPDRAFRRVCPELDHGARTRAGTPVRLQLLGSDPSLLADNAARAAAFDPFGIDLNFGCPAPTVNRHRGGAALLDEPELLYRICAAVRAAVPPALPVTAKLRLGIRDTSRTLDCVRALETGGASELAVHARTRADGYRPPARWEWLGRVRAAVRVPVIANGEIWTAADWQRCREISGCTDVMLGRGAVADPFLAWRLRAALGDGAGSWRDVAPMLGKYWAGVLAKVEPRHAPGRLKQWLGLLRRTWPEADALYGRLRPLRQVDEVSALLNATVAAAPPEICKLSTSASAGTVSARPLAVF